MSDDGSEQAGSSGPGKGFYIVLGVLAVGGLAALLLAGGGGPEPVGPLSQSALQVEPDSGAYAAARGPEDAPVTLMEFADYQCSHCATFASLPGPALKRDYVETGEVRMLLYDFPLSRQSNAIPAALAARCAGDQGKYWAMHGRLFSSQSEWARARSPESRFADYARGIGLDMDRFNRCYSEKKHLEEIMASRRYGDQLQVTGTPTIFVNGHRARSYAYEEVSSLIERELAAADSAAEDSAAASPGSGDAAGAGR